MLSVIRWIPSLIWMGFIFYMSSRTGEELHSMFPLFEHFDWGHFAAYFILSLFFLFALYPVKTVSYPGLWAVLLSVLYGLTDEWHQMFVPTRTPQVTDLLLDFTGAFTAVIFYSIILSLWKKAKGK